MSWSVMAVLVVVAASLWVKQFHYDPSVLTPQPVVQPSRESADQRPGLAVLSALSPPSWEPMGAQEVFDALSLSDKINGKAELYLSAGFLSLTCQRFSLPQGVGGWLEVFLYDMGTLEQAFGVFSAQRRSEGQPLALTPYAYKTANALFFVHGRHYVEIVASEPSEAMDQAMVSFGRRFVDETGVDRQTVEEIAWFPEQGQVPDSVVLLLSDAFGFEGMKKVFSARYVVDGTEVTAFVSRQEDDQSARALALAYAAFLVENGGERISDAAGFPGGGLVNIFGAFELIFSEGRFVVGVRDAETRAAAERMAWRLRKKMEGPGT